MNKIRFLTMAVITLALLNLAAMAFIWSRRNPPPFEGPRKIIIERLHLDQTQVAAYNLLVDKHRADIRQKDREMASSKQAIYRQLLTDDFSKKDSLLGEVGRLQMAVEQIHLAHFQDIKKLCRTEQLADFQNLIAELEQLFAKPKRPEKK